MLEAWINPFDYRKTSNLYLSIRRYEKKEKTDYRNLLEFENCILSYVKYSTRRARERLFSILQLDEPRLLLSFFLFSFFYQKWIYSSDCATRLGMKLGGGPFAVKSARDRDKRKTWKNCTANDRLWLIGMNAQIWARIIGRIYSLIYSS